MSNCVICKINVIGQCLICNTCFKAWPKGTTFSEYAKQPYNPEPKVIPPGVGTSEDYPE